MAHFYLNESLASAVVGGTVELVGTEARHAVTVSRVRVGESLSIGNGSGLIVNGEVREVDAGRLVLLVASVSEAPRPVPAIHLVQALAKGDRDELAVQAATELGVDAVLPWAASRSIVRWEGPKAAKGRERWAAIVREATKQSMRPWLPEVTEVVPTRQLVALAATTRMLVLDPAASERLSQFALTSAGTDKAISGTRVAEERAAAVDERDIVLVVGPEGGITPGELDALTAAGASTVRLGDAVLRTSTAGPAAIAVLNAKLGRW